MEKRYIYSSVLFHIVILLLCIFDIPYFARQHDFDDTPPIMVNLDDVVISDMTNLPELAVRGEENKPATRKEKTNVEEAAAQPPKAVEKAENKEPEPVIETPEIKAPSLIEDAPKMEESKDEPSKEDKKPIKKKKPAPVPQKKPQIKPTKKPEPKKPATNNTTKANSSSKATTKTANPLESLFKATDDLQKQIGEQDAPAQVRYDAPVNNLGIESGTSKGSYFSELSVSGIDFVKTKIQESWKTIAGGKDDRNIEVVINVTLTKEGEIISVNIDDMRRYRSDNYFQALADSAERAIHIAQDVHGVFRTLAKQNASDYNKWKDIRFTFTPLGLAK